MGRRTWLPALLAATLALACATAKQTPAEVAADRLETLAESHAGDATLMVRLNPAPCDCPEWEVRLDGTWHRAYLEPKDPEGPVEALRARLQGFPDRPPPDAARVAGRLSGSTRLSGTRAPCLVLKVLQVCEDEACTPPE